MASFQPQIHLIIFFNKSIFQYYILTDFTYGLMRYEFMLYTPSPIGAACSMFSKVCADEPVLLFQADCTMHIPPDKCKIETNKLFVYFNYNFYLYTKCVHSNELHSNTLQNQEEIKCVTFMRCIFPNCNPIGFRLYNKYPQHKYIIISNHFTLDFNCLFQNCTLIR